jgi:hypothetical protein
MNARLPVVDDLLRNLKLLEARLAEYFEVLTATSGAGVGMEPGGMTDENRSRRVCA